MGDPWEEWGELSEEEKEAIQSGSLKLSDEEFNELFTGEGDQVRFRIYQKPEIAKAADSDWEEGDEYEVSEVPLISAEDFDRDPDITPEDKEAAKPIDEMVSSFEDYYGGDAEESEGEGAPLPPVVDHRASQSRVKHQGARNTCVAHASLAALEAYGHIPDNLSEQYAHYKFNEFLNRPHNQNRGLLTTDAAKFLARLDGRICLEEHWPYIRDQAAINRLVGNNTYGPPPDAQHNDDFGIDHLAYKIIGDEGLAGQSIRNPRFLEVLLHQSYDIVIGAYVAWDDKKNRKIIVPVLDSHGNPIDKKKLNGHAMLVVGYHRPLDYLIIKNSWGDGWGREGYGWFHYNYARTYFKYGFVVHRAVPVA